MRISEISSGTYQSQVKRVSIQTISNVEKHETPFIWSKFNRLSSMQSTVTPDIVDIPERTIEKTSVPESSEKSFIFNRNRIIFITIGVLFALSTSITAVALAIKFRS
ncbi:unnamed protein product [Rotaria sordida]|uniref:Uncharacterized protein n=1 Tax=Rotaria sordida TaxID=392033 RepID=A0A814ZLF0_9BILA|nr:unnamed protein product [Rotaria sordida]CAF1245420.1 unnamed protein product [Rotaria sordida]CAF1246337.1 unnamed protein product [Rotaria sordida]CAF1353230.1 unnamed protein product [Rotaria sordida]CAF1527350.1 unnamed protein product [Rotaria sordida]